jgi:hypothetical protein
VLAVLAAAVGSVLFFSSYRHLGLDPSLAVAGMIASVFVAFGYAALSIISTVGYWSFDKQDQLHELRTRYGPRVYVADHWLFSRFVMREFCR